MGRKRKTAVLVNGSAMADEAKTSNAIPVTPSPGNNPTDVDPENVENNGLPFPNGSEATQNQPRVENKRVRRSCRLSGYMSPDRTRVVMKPIVEHVNLVENENEKEETEETGKVDALPVVNGKESGVETQAEQVSPSSDLKDLSLDEKVNYLVRMVDEFKSKVFEKTNEGPSSDISYKSLYIQAQKKYEALMEDHYEAIKSLEFARGQIAAYEKMKDATREVILVSGKLTGGGGTSVEHQTTQNCMPSSAVTHADHDIPKQKKATYYKKKKANN